MPVTRARIPIVVVDPDPETHHAVAGALSASFRIHSAFLLTEASSIVAAIEPRLCIISTAFDAMDLLIFCRVVRSRYPHVTLLGATRAGMVRDVTRAMDLGARGFIEKPIRPEKLMATLERHL